jgi:hypothetical protein
LLDAGSTEFRSPLYVIRHHLSGEKTLSITFGKYPFEETLSHLVTTRLKEKEEMLRKGFVGRPEMQYMIALDTRSLSALPLDPEPGSEYEQQMAEIHRPYFDRLRFFRQQVILACQSYASKSPLIKGILLWGNKRLKSPIDEVQRRYSICLVTPERSIEVDKQNLAAELENILIKPSPRQ